jgi:hypothetical protein
MLLSVVEYFQNILSVKKIRPSLTTLKEGLKMHKPVTLTNLRRSLLTISRRLYVSII